MYPKLSLVPTKKLIRNSIRNKNRIFGKSTEKKDLRWLLRNVLPDFGDDTICRGPTGRWFQIEVATLFFRQDLLRRNLNEATSLAELGEGREGKAR